MEGQLSVDEHAQIHVEPSDGKRRQSYKLFDHITVTIQLSNSSDVHARSLAFYLLSRYPLAAETKNSARHGNKDEIKISKMDFLQEIKKDKQNLENKLIEKDEFTDNSLHKEKTKEKVSMYKFFEDMRSVGEANTMK